MVLLCFFYRSALCFLGVFLITKNRKNPQAFEPFVTMDMASGL